MVSSVVEGTIGELTVRVLVMVDPPEVMVVTMPAAPPEPPEPPEPLAAEASEP